MKNLIITLIVLASAFFSTAHANKNNPEVWECTGFSLAAAIVNEPMTVKATSNPARTSGTVSVNGLKYDAEYQLQGFVRIWRIQHKKPTESLDILIIAPDYSGALYLNVQP